MPVTTTTDVYEFLALAQPGLEADEVVISLVLGVSLRYQREANPQPAQFAVATEDGALCGAAVYLPKREPILAGSAAAGRTLAEALHAAGWQLDEVGGPDEIAAQFARTWAARTGRASRAKMAMRLFSLHAVNHPTYPPGELVPASEVDLALLADWFGEFEADAFGRRDDRLALEIATRRVRGGEMMLWTVDGQPVSMAGWGRPTRHTVAISAVYTPLALRGRGYASACVARLSQTMLDRGYTACTLYTDLANRTSNHIYQQIGYRPVNDFTRYQFG